jgi:hypothetical protein
VVLLNKAIKADNRLKSRRSSAKKVSGISVVEKAISHFIAAAIHPLIEWYRHLQQKSDSILDGAMVIRQFMRRMETTKKNDSMMLLLRTAFITEDYQKQP